MVPERLLSHAPFCLPKHTCRASSMPVMIAADELRKEAARLDAQIAANLQTLGFDVREQT